MSLFDFFNQQILVFLYIFSLYSAFSERCPYVTRYAVLFYAKQKIVLFDMLRNFNGKLGFVWKLLMVTGKNNMIRMLYMIKDIE
jgi:hypothetical protein